MDNPTWDWACFSVDASEVGSSLTEMIKNTEK